MLSPEFWTSSRPIARAVATALSPLGALYGLSVRMRRARARPFRPKARVICVGNLTAGGTGKTPVAIALGRMLKARGRKVAFLTRGYGGRLAGPIEVNPHRHASHEVGDEPLLLAGCAPTIVARDRAAGARLADSIGAEFIVMDDGFQNFQIVKDLSLVIVDAATGFGNGRLIPAGPLRESIADGLARADAIVLMGHGKPEIPFAGVITRAHAFPVAPDALAGKGVFAFAGIGHPERFFELLQSTGAAVLGHQSFADHHRFNDLELSVLRLAAERLHALLVTTEKDYVRLEPYQREGIVPVPVVARFDDDRAVAALLDRLSEGRNDRAA